MTTGKSHVGRSGEYTSEGTGDCSFTRRIVVGLCPLMGGDERVGQSALRTDVGRTK